MVHPIDKQGAAHDVEEVDKGAANVDGKQEHQVHDKQEEGDANPAIEQHPIQPFALGLGELALLLASLLYPLVDMAVADIRQLQIDILPLMGAGDHIVGGGLLTGQQGLLHHRILFQQAQGATTGSEVVRGEQGLQLRQIVFKRVTVIELQGRLRLTDKLPDLLLEGGNLFAVVGREGHHRATERFAELALVDDDAALLQDIQLVEHHHHGQAQFAQLQREVEGALQIGGVDDVEQQVGLLALGKAAGDLLVQTAILTGQAIDAGQIHQLEVMLTRAELTHLLVDGDTTPVAYLLAGAGQGVEQGGLAAIGVTYRYQGVIHTGSTSIVL